MFLAVLEITPEPEPPSETSQVRPTPSAKSNPTVLFRVWLFFFGIVAPAVCLLAGLNGFGFNRIWQSGEWKVYAELLLRYPAMTYPLTLILFSFLCLAVWCFDPRQSKRIWIRLGLQTGLMIACLYLLLALVAYGLSTLLASLLVVPFLTTIHVLIRVAVNSKRRLTIRKLMILTAAIAAIAAWGRTMVKDVQSFHLSELPMGVVMVLIVAAPTNGAIAFLLALRSMQKNFQSVAIGKASWIVAWMTYLCSFFFLWRLSMQTMFVEYAKLPTTEPKCYVGSAAAHGHPWFVQSRRPFGEDGPAINLQMQRIKLLEFGLATSCPRIHRFIRTTYDWVGPPLAKICRSNQVFADLTYVALKPIEFLAVGIRWASGISAQELASLYSSR